MNLKPLCSRALGEKRGIIDVCKRDMITLDLLSIGFLLSEAPSDSLCQSENIYLVKMAITRQILNTVSDFTCLPPLSILPEFTFINVPKVSDVISPIKGPLKAAIKVSQTGQQTLISSENAFSTGLSVYKENLNKNPNFGFARESENKSGNNGIALAREEKKPSKRKVFVPPIKDTPKVQENKTEFELWAEKEGLDMNLIASIQAEILEQVSTVSWNDIAGLKDTKRIIDETIVYPALRPDIFAGLRRPTRGILLFGPPGTGKTMIGRAIASQLRCTFYSISASSLTSKWVGESERLIKTLFRLAVFTQPSVIFIDEIDSLLSCRAEGEMDVVRRIKTEFFVQLDGARTNENDKVLIVATTNRPEQLDEAARRRFGKKLYIPLPDQAAKLELMQHEIQKERDLGFKYEINISDLQDIANQCERFSGADIKALLKEAAMEPVRALATITNNVDAWNIQQLESVSKGHFQLALKRVKPTITNEEVCRYRKWNAEFGSFETE